MEVERPRRAERRGGKSNRIDALAAAKCVLGGENLSTPRRRGVLSALRTLLNARRAAIAERTRLLNQLQALTVTAPVALRERIGDGTGKQLDRPQAPHLARPLQTPRRHLLDVIEASLTSRVFASDPPSVQRAGRVLKLRQGRCRSSSRRDPLIAQKAPTEKGTSVARRARKATGPH